MTFPLTFTEKRGGYWTREQLSPVQLCTNFEHFFSHPKGFSISSQNMSFWRTYRLFMCQDENEPENESFRSLWIKPVTNEPGPVL